MKEREKRMEIGKKRKEQQICEDNKNKRQRINRKIKE